MDYTTALNKHTKRRKKSQNLNMGSIVLVKDQALFSNKWPLGRIMKTYTGSDKLVRVVDVHTATGTYKRPTGTYKRPTGTYKRPTGTYKHPTGKIVLLLQDDVNTRHSVLAGEDVGNKN